MASDNANKKAVSVENLEVAVNQIQKDYAKKEEVREQIAQAALGGLIFASNSEILALFEDKSQSSSGQG